MALHDWDIIETIAVRHFNGQEIVIDRGRHGTMPAAIAAWEAQERQRMLTSVVELGRLVDRAMDRLPRRRSPVTGKVINVPPL